MSFIISTQAEILKTKRTASSWLSLVAVALVPVVLFIVLFFDSDAATNLAADPWKNFLKMGWLIVSGFLLPMYIILVTTLVTQIEYKNNTWKQVFASPQSIGNIFFSKFVTVQLMILASLLLFNVLMLVLPMLANLFLPKYTFLAKPVNWERLLLLNGKAYVSILGISAIQYALSLRYKNFIVPVGIGLSFLIGSVVALNLNWAYIDYYPYAYVMLSNEAIDKPGAQALEQHELYSVAYFMLFILFGFLHMKLRKGKG